MMTDLPVDQVRTLLAVVDEGTFDAAASALHVTPSAVSQRIKALEQRVGQVLLLRTKPVRLTDGGQLVVRFARQLDRLERDVREQLGVAGESAHRVPVAVNSDSLATWFLTALSRVPAELRICFELYREDQDRTERLLREGLVMAAVTSSGDPVPGCTVRPLGQMRYHPIASPDFVARWRPDAGKPLRQWLPRAPMVTFDRHDDLQDRFLRAVCPGATAEPLARHRIPASEVFVEAVAAGLGWGMAPRSQTASRIGSGTLVDLDPRHPIDVPLFWQQWKLDSPTLSAVTRAVTATAAELLDGRDGRLRLPTDR